MQIAKKYDKNKTIKVASQVLVQQWPWDNLMTYEKRHFSYNKKKINSCRSIDSFAKYRKNVIISYQHFLLFPYNSFCSRGSLLQGGLIVETYFRYASGFHYLSAAITIQPKMSKLFLLLAGIWKFLFTEVFQHIEIITFYLGVNHINFRTPFVMTQITQPPPTPAICVIKFLAKSIVH